MQRDRREALGLELRGIISTDRQAAALLDEARHTVRQIEAFTQKQKEEILAEAEKRRVAAEKQADAEAAGALARQKADAQHRFQEQKRRLAAAMQQHHDAWVDELVAEILGTGASGQ